jgi:nitrite reductase/ring-hydroxylating ferredoxin subunit
MFLVVRRSDLAANAAATFDVDAKRCLVVDLDGDVRAYEVHGPAARDAHRTAVRDGTLYCPLHGWPVGPDEPRCGAFDRCCYRPLDVAFHGEEIRVDLDAS